jgi:elongation factor Ts
MSEITAAAVKALRERTGAGMMDCKRALQEAGGDEEQAIDILRKSGAAKAAKRSHREVSEGTVAIVRDEATGAVAMVEVASETDFVARNDDFLAFANRAAETALAHAPTGEPRPGEELLDLPPEAPLGTELDDLRARIGENLALTRFVRFEPTPGGTLASYVHFGNRIGVLVELEGAGESTDLTALARDLAMHIAASRPAGISPDDIPEEERERERRVLIEQATAEGKPPEIAEKIVEGRMRKFYEQAALLWQPFVKDPDRKISDLLKEAGADVAVTRFARFDVTE